VRSATPLPARLVLGDGDQRADRLDLARRLELEGLPRDAVALVSDPSYETATAFMQMTDVLDCLIPRGGPSLIAAMREHARVPYVLDGDGNCHCTSTSSPTSTRRSPS